MSLWGAVGLTTPAGNRDEDCRDGSGSIALVLGSWSAGDEEVKEVVEEERERENCASEFPIFLLAHLL